MKLSDLELQQTYALTRDVKNPEADKRVSHDWRKRPVWPKGMRLKTSTFRVNEDVVWISLYAGQYAHQDIIAKKAPVDLLEALVPVEPTVNETLQMRGLLGWKSEAIDLLLTRGVITREQLVAAAVEVEASEPSDK